MVRRDTPVLRAASFGDSVGKVGSLCGHAHWAWHAQDQRFPLIFSVGGASNLGFHLSTKPSEDFLDLVVSQ